MRLPKGTGARMRAIALPDEEQGALFRRLLLAGLVEAERRVERLRAKLERNGA